ncbi:MULTISPECIES: N-acetyltransferase [unclassified Lactococcus]|uniref:GNAT family N-acetyltransferase n=1 Tax=unclassified Lactococcus TaxID=2643510 RepID=UPI0011CBF2DE|nr:MULTISPECIES: GNAT family N-acetyltransferase [unclassified Lactococcus]MQW23016.1 GNAT family N-acetyltransferase [Lactococcus sp. dk101]TXK44361.1 GNAT family N-acetyltransferase [Lactococcus sp. dk310]TXK50171.1 GNAT family N-acetyltransferase [Lactococcus sp. dk322]
MKIRKAQEKDIPELLSLLTTIADYHFEARPDIFTANSSKYTAEQVKTMLVSTDKPIFVAVDALDNVQGYAMCQIRERKDHSVFVPFRVLYLDDLCVNEKDRKSGIGSQLMTAIKTFAREENCSRIELNVWEFPGSALHFYEENGFKTQRRGLELWL